MKTKLLFFLFFPIFIWGQDFVDGESLNNKTSKGITVVEFWAEWNSANEVKFLEKLKDCKKYRLCIVSNSKAAASYNIFAIPTVIIFDNGEEVNRYNPNILMQLAATREEVQENIDEIILKKFQ
tara:strand:+ start:2185 stop:2556 length:372 start_codon:yes stop_codon:yes gene_type:complete